MDLAQRQLERKGFVVEGIKCITFDGSLVFFNSFAYRSTWLSQWEFESTIESVWEQSKWEHSRGLRKITIE